MNKSHYSFANGFNSLNKEYNQVNISNSKSNLPTWLDGSLIKVGPAQFTIGKTKVKHWFDGLAMLYKFDINNGNITFSNSFIKSAQYKAHSAGQMQYDEFATQAPLKIFERIKHIFGIMAGKNMLNPSCNVNIIKNNKSFFAMTEVNNNLEFAPQTLETLNPVSYTDQLEGQMNTAHPIYDNATGELFNILTYIAPAKVKYQLYKITTHNQEQKRELISEFNKPYLFYIHSFFVTTNYIILQNGPLQTTATSLLNNSFNSTLKYNKKHSCEFILINRQSGKMTTIPVKNFIFLHGINSYETSDEQLIIDLIAYPEEGNPYNMFYLDKLANNHLNLSTEIRRYHLDIKNQTCKYHRISDVITEFPNINQNYQNREYQYLYATYCNENRPHDFLNGLIKLDLKNPELKLVWFEPDLYPSEPIFIQNPQAKSEDDGVIITNVFDAQRKISLLLILDATNFSEIARFDLPCHIPFTLHGNFYPNLI